MTYSEAVNRLVRGMRADTHDYDSLRGLLEQQFQAALRLRTAELCEVAERITALARVLDARRLERLRLGGLLVKKDSGPVSVSITAISARLPTTMRATFAAEWNRLEARVRDCKALNTRNCQLLMSQFEIMQRLLTNEVHTYAPA
jgi:flagella synthesis protein FlgN